MLPSCTVNLCSRPDNTGEKKWLEAKMQKRWIKSIASEAEECKVRMPWERGLRREAFIARRKAAAGQVIRQIKTIQVPRTASA